MPVPVVCACKQVMKPLPPRTDPYYLLPDSVRGSFTEDEHARAAGGGYHSTVPPSSRPPPFWLPLAKRAGTTFLCSVDQLGCLSIVHLLVDCCSQIPLLCQVKRAHASTTHASQAAQLANCRQQTPSLTAIHVYVLAGGSPARPAVRCFAGKWFWSGCCTTPAFPAALASRSLFWRFCVRFWAAVGHQLPSYRSAVGSCTSGIVVA